ncbi:nuclear transport factor 2 family protein [Alteromonadaceae bacterium BrNp21-10]|nr:nuclear transport factor 2 family protein [Alteromonadaceae bacterium BrNp21-10]
MNTFMSKNRLKTYTSLLALLFATFGAAANNQTATTKPVNQQPSSLQNNGIPIKHSTFLHAYEQAWEELDANKRLEIINTFWTKNSVYSDPSAVAIGPEQLNDMISRVRAQYPVWVGTHGKVYSTGDNFWYTWEIRVAEDKLLFSGSDVIKLAKDGKGIEIIGFFSI